MTLSLLAHEAITILADGDSEGGAGTLGLIFLLSGPLFYGYVFLRYRNTDKRHHHERETEAAMLDVKAVDNHVQTLTGVSHSRMRGANNHEVRAKANNGFEMTPHGMSLDLGMGSVRLGPGGISMGGPTPPGIVPGAGAPGAPPGVVPGAGAPQPPPSAYPPGAVPPPPGP